MNTKHVTEAVNQKTHKNADCGPSLVPPRGVPEWPGSGRSTLSANPVLEPGGRKAEDRVHWGVASRQWDFYPYSLVTTGRVPGTEAKVTVHLQGSRTRAQAEKQLLRALQALAVGQGQGQGQSEARQLGGQSCLGGQVWLPCGGLAGGLTACCSWPGTGPPEELHPGRGAGTGAERSQAAGRSKLPGGSGVAPLRRAGRGAGGLTACCSQPGTGPPASRRNCTDISRMDAMSSRRPSNWGSRARRRSQLKEIRLLLSGK